MEKKKMTYEQAMTRLETLVQTMERGELDIDQLGEALKESQQLIKFCRDKLYQAEKQVKTVMDEQ